MQVNYRESADLRTLNKFIMQKGLGAGDVVVLRPSSFDTLALEHKNRFGVSMEVPHIVDDVQVLPENLLYLAEDNNIEAVPKFIPVKDFPPARDNQEINPADYLDFEDYF